MPPLKHSFSSRWKYGFDNFMSKGGLSVFLALLVLFFGAVVAMSALRVVVNFILPDAKFADFWNSVWIQFLQISDGGAVAEDGESNILNRLVGIATMLLGMVIFSSLVAFITSQFEAKMEELRKGKSNVIEKNHTLILGFGDRALEIIRELIVANQSETKPAIVVLADQPKDEMDEFFRDRIEDFQNTRFITREGSTSSLQFLKRAGVESAKSVIILNTAPEDAEAQDKNLADARVLKTILAVLSCTGEEHAPPILAELYSHQRQDLAKSILEGVVSTIDNSSILAKLMVQTSRISGLAKIYDQIVGFEGCEFYFHKPEAGWKGLTYEKSVFHYPTACVIGIKTSQGKIALNPSKTTVLLDQDELILLAEDDSNIIFKPDAVEFLLPPGSPATAQPKVKEAQLLVGWSIKGSIIIEEYCRYMVDGSQIHVLVQEVDEELKHSVQALAAKYPHISIKTQVSTLGDAFQKGSIKPEQYDNILILSGDGGEAELRDSVTIATLLEFRGYFRKLGKEVKTQIITEVADSENIQIVEDAGVKDFLISNQFVSKIYAQVSEEPLVQKIYGDLFSSDGSETYLKPAHWYLSDFSRSWKFGDLCAAALRRNESCIGVRYKALEDDKEKHYGIVLNPPKSDLLTLSPGDWFITLAENES